MLTEAEISEGLAPVLTASRWRNVGRENDGVMVAVKMVLVGEGVVCGPVEAVDHGIGSGVFVKLEFALDAGTEVLLLLLLLSVALGAVVVVVVFGWEVHAPFSHWQLAARQVVMEPNKLHEQGMPSLQLWL